MTGRLSRLRDQAARRLWPTGLLLGALAGLATFSSAPGEYIGDNRYDQFAAPGTRLARSLSLWDGTRGLGRVREDLWLGLNTPLAVLRGIGLPIWASERVFHSLLITLGGLGLVAVVRVFRPRIGLGHLLGGLVYAFGPYSAVFLQPSNLYAAYAAAPWLALAALRGPASARPWRWAACFALVVFLLGNVDPPGVVLVALVVLPATAWTVWVERSAGLRRTLGWIGRAALLSVGVSLAALYKTWVAAATFGTRLDTTESPAIVNVASSWTESLRGVGFWVSYFRGSTLARPQTEVLFSSPVVVVASLVLPTLALAALAASRGRARAFLGACLLLGAAVMVGTFPAGHPSPYGRLLDRVYEAVPTFAAFRNSYKVGGLLLIGIAGLLGVGLVEVQDRWAGLHQRRAVASAAAFLVVAVAAVPFWSGNLYDASKGYDSIPAYWTQAIDYVDRLPGSGRVLVLPGTTRTQYRWGWVGDDILDARLHRPHAVDTAIALSEPQAADLLHVLSTTVGDGSYQAGTIGPILRRLGIDRILIRNDTDWVVDQTFRPDALDALRHDPDLRLLRAFGRPGQGTTDAIDHSDAAERERRLRPVEVYALADAGPAGPRLVPSADRPLLVSGDGSAWPVLARRGALAAPGPVRYTGTVGDADLADAVEGSRGVVVTDTNRRRVVTVNGFHLDEGPTLAAGQDQDRAAADLFDRAGSQAVAWFPDATRIAAAGGAARGLQGAQPAVRPAAAFDGTAATAWSTFESIDQVGTRLRVDLRRPTALSSADLTAVNAAPGVNHLTAARLRFSDGSVVPVPLEGRSGAVRFARRTVRWVEVEIAAVSGGAPRPVGFSEVSLGDLDLDEWIDLPDDLARRAAADPAVARAVAAAPLTFQVQRAAPVGGLAVEPTLRRRLRVPARRTFTVTASLRPLEANTVALAETLAAGCTGTGPANLTIAGRPVRFHLVGSAAAVRPGQVLAVEGCAPVTLAAGWQRLAVAGSPVTDLALSSPGTGDGAPAATTPSRTDADGVDPAVRVLGRSPGRFTLRVDAPDGGRLLTGESWEGRWFATVDGRSLGRATSLDTLSGWDLPAGRDLRVTLVYRPQQRFGSVLLTSGAFVALCLVLVARRPRRAAPQEPATSSS